MVMSLLACSLQVQVLYSFIGTGYVDVEITKEDKVSYPRDFLSCMRVLNDVFGAMHWSRTTSLCNR